MGVHLRCNDFEKIIFNILEDQILPLAEAKNSIHKHLGHTTKFSLIVQLLFTRYKQQECSTMYIYFFLVLMYKSFLEYSNCTTMRYR